MNYKPGATDAAALPVISAAVAAFLGQEKSENMPVWRQQAAASGSVWSLRGREVLMDRRQQITVRRDKKK